MRTFRRPTLVIASFSLLLTAGATVPVAAASPAGVDASPAGWVVVRKPSVGSYTPKPRDRGNSTGGSVTVSRSQVGEWIVTWQGLSAAGYGDLQVSALGSTLRHCISYTWGSSGSDGYGEIYCYKRTNVSGNQFGAPVDVPFVAALVAEDAPVTGPAGRVAYAWMDDPTTDGTPDTNYNYSSAGGDLTSDHIAKGSYIITVPGVGKADGVPLVTGYQGNLNRCQVRGWAKSGSDVKTTVDCVDFSGARANAEFDFLYIRHVGLEGYEGGPAASLLANKPTATSYHPDPAHAWSSAGKTTTIVRTSKGVYTVKLPGMPAGGAAIVTSYGPRSTPRACQIGSIRTSSTPQQVVVRCFTYAGVAADSRFVLSYTK